MENLPSKPFEQWPTHILLFVAFAIWSELAKRLDSTVAKITMGWNDAFTEAPCAAQVSASSSLPSIISDCENAEEPSSSSEKEEQNSSENAPSRPSDWKPPEPGYPPDAPPWKRYKRSHDDE